MATETEETTPNQPQGTTISVRTFLIIAIIAFVLSFFLKKSHNAVIKTIGIVLLLLSATSILYVSSLVISGEKTL